MKATQLYLYHGTDVVIDAPKWNHGSRYRDFGHCFYTTHSREMATDWAEKRSLLYPVVNCYVVNFKDLQTGTLKVKRFKADAEWAEFIYNNRYNRHYRRPDYDIIIGPVADKGLSEQMAKARREGKTFEEIAPLIQYNRFRDMQVCFCSDYALTLLKRIG